MGVSIPTHERGGPAHSGRSAVTDSPSGQLYTGSSRRKFKAARAEVTPVHTNSTRMSPKYVRNITRIRGARTRSTEGGGQRGQRVSRAPRPSHKRSRSPSSQGSSVFWQEPSPASPGDKPPRREPVTGHLPAAPCGEPPPAGPSARQTRGLCTGCPAQASPLQHGRTQGSCTPQLGFTSSPMWPEPGPLRDLVFAACH